MGVYAEMQRNNKLITHAAFSVGKKIATEPRCINYRTSSSVFKVPYCVSDNQLLFTWSIYRVFSVYA